MTEHTHPAGEDIHMKMIWDLCTSLASSSEASQSLKLCQTHASSVILTSHLAYKLKKPKNFGFFDYSTPQRRRHFCIQEVVLNTPFAPGIYQGVAPVLHLPEDRLRFGPALPPEQVPQPGSAFAEGKVVDYAVVMTRLSDDTTLEALVRFQHADAALLRAIARFVATFHAASDSTPSIAAFGRIEVIQQNWEENFAQIQPYIGRTLDQQTYERIASYVHHFLHYRRPLFEQRIQDHKIRDCHGDLRLQHIYVLDAHQPDAPYFALLDRIEFNERFRYSDVAAEIAFLTMELDETSRHDLAIPFLREYTTSSHDEPLYEILPFYQCYRACVRGKVLSFQLDEREVDANQQQKALEQATALFRLAAFYARYPVRPLLIMVGGLMGTGKSTIAQMLQQHYHWALASSDTIRKRLAHLNPTYPQADAFEQGIYTYQWNKRTYDTLRAFAISHLAQGCSVLLDASFSRRADRQMLAQIAKDHQAIPIFLECLCPPSVSLERLARRWESRQRGGNTPQVAASDGRPDLYNMQADAWEPFLPAQESGTEQRRIHTNQPIEHCLEDAFQALALPHLLCPLSGQA